MTFEEALAGDFSHNARCKVAFQVVDSLLATLLDKTPSPAVMDAATALGFLFGSALAEDEKRGATDDRH